MSNPAPERKTAVLFLRSTNRNFPLDLVPELEKAGHAVSVAEGLDEFIASPVRSRPFLAVLELGNTADLDRAVIVFDWIEQMQPLAPARYLLLLSSKNIQLGDRVHRFGSAEIAMLPQPARNLLFKLELQSRLLASQSGAEKGRKSAKGFSTTEEHTPDGHRRILVARGQEEKAGSWHKIDSSPQGQVRWRWIRNPERDAPGEKDDYSWQAESASEPSFDKKLDAWVIEGERANLVCLKGETKLFDATANAVNAEKKKTNLPAAAQPGEVEEAAAPRKADTPNEPAKKAAPSRTSAEAKDAEGKKLPRPAPAGTTPERTETDTQDTAPASEEKKKHNPVAARPATEPEGPDAAATARASTASALARLKRQLDQKNAQERAPLPGPGELLYNAAAGERSSATAQHIQQRESEAPGAPFRVIPSRDEEEKKSAERATPAAPGAPAKSSGRDPDDFSRSASLGSLREKTTSSDGTEEKKTPGVARGESTSVPIHVIPSRDPADSPETAGAPEVTMHTGGPNEPQRAPAVTIHHAPSADPTPGHRPATSAEAAASRSKNSSTFAAAAPPKLPETSLPGDAFDSQLPALGGGQGASAGVSSQQPASASAPNSRLAEGELLPAPREKAAAAPVPAATIPGVQAPIENEQAFGREHAAAKLSRAVKGRPSTPDNLEVSRTAPREESEEDSRRFLKDRLFLLMTLQELSDKDSSWHPVSKYRIYLGAQHRYYGLPHPGDVLPLWIYEGELAPEFIDEKKSWKFYDRLPAAAYSLETLPHEVLEYLYKLARKEMPVTSEQGRSGLHVGAGSEELPAGNGEVPDHYEPEAKKKNRGAFGKVLEFLKSLFGG